MCGVCVDAERPRCAAGGRPAEETNWHLFPFLPSFLCVIWPYLDVCPCARVLRTRVCVTWSEVKRESRGRGGVARERQKWQKSMWAPKSTLTSSGSSSLADLHHLSAFFFFFFLYWGETTGVTGETLFSFLGDAASGESQQRYKYPLTYARCGGDGSEGTLASATRLSKEQSARSGADVAGAFFFFFPASPVHRLLHAAAFPLQEYKKKKINKKNLAVRAPLPVLHRAYVSGAAGSLGIGSSAGFFPPISGSASLCAGGSRRTGRGEEIEVAARDPRLD